MTRPDTFPEALLWVAHYIDETDRIMLKLIEEHGIDVSSDYNFAGKHAQEDLRAMAQLILDSPSLMIQLNLLWLIAAPVITGIPDQYDKEGNDDAEG